MIATYSTSSNANAGARAALGKTATNGVHFTTQKNDDGRWTWSAMAGAPALPEKAAKAPKKTKAVKKPAKTKAKTKAARKPRVVSDGTIGGRASSQKALALVQRATGVTVKEGAERTGTQPHSFRGLISRLDKEFHIKRERVKGKVVYSGGTPRRKGATQAAETAAAGATA